MKKVVIALVVLLLAGVVAYWYFHRDNDKARDVLPQDATAAMVLEPAELASELGLNLKDIFNLVSSFGDVEGTIDFTKPVYAFTTESGLGGISLNVEDADKLQKLIEPFAAIEEKDGFTRAYLKKDYSSDATAVIPEEMLDGGWYFFTVTAKDANGNESDPVIINEGINLAS